MKEKIFKLTFIALIIALTLVVGCNCPSCRKAKVYKQGVNCCDDVQKLVAKHKEALTALDMLAQKQKSTQDALNQVNIELEALKNAKPVRTFQTSGQNLVIPTINVPNQAVLGKEYPAEVMLTATQDVAGVVVWTTIPDQAEYIRSEPNASVNGKVVTWNVGNMNKDEQKTLKLWLRALKEGQLGLCYVIKAYPRYCASTFVGKPVLAIEKTGPAKAELNQLITYDIVVKNIGSTVAKDVVVTDNVPEGLSHVSGKSVLTFQAGDLEPQASKSFQVQFTTMRRGRVVNVAVATSSNADSVQDDAPTVVELKNLDLSFICTKELFIEKRGKGKIVVSNNGDTELTNVVLTAVVPQDVKIISSIGEPKVNGNTLVWEMPNLAPGANKVVGILVTTEIPGKKCVEVNVTCNEGISKAATCCTLWKGYPVLAIKKTGPATALLNEEFAYNIVVKNIGTAVANDVVVTDPVPAGLVHASGKEVLTFQLGNLEPQQEKALTVNFKAVKTGEVMNIATATASNAKEVSDPAPTKIIERAMTLKVACPKESFLGKRVKQGVLVTNEGTVAIKNVVITVEIPSQVRVISTTGSPEQMGGKVVWRVPSVGAGEQVKHGLVIISRTPGDWCMKVTASCDEGIVKTDECCTKWKGLPALLIEVIDTVDPLIPGEETQYVIKITNQGTAEDQNIKIVAKFPEEISPVKATGATANKLEGKTVTYEPYPVLAPKQMIEFTITAKAMKVGDSRLRVYLTSKLLKKPVPEEESTQVY